MILLENGNAKSASSSEDEMPLLEGCSDVDVEDLVHSDLLVTMRVLGIQSEEDNDEE